MGQKVWDNLRSISGWDVEFLELELDAFEVLRVLQAVDEVAAHDAGYVRERVIGAVHNAGRAFLAEDRLVAFGASDVLAVVSTNKICNINRQ